MHAIFRSYRRLRKPYYCTTSLQLELLGHIILGDAACYCFYPANTKLITQAQSAGTHSLREPASMDSDCSTKLVAEASDQKATSSKRKHRQRLREKNGNKKVLFYAAGFRMGEISPGVHDLEDNTDVQECKSEDCQLDCDEGIEDDIADRYEDYEFLNMRTRCKPSSPTSNGNTKQNRAGHPSGLMKIAKENKASRRVWNVSKNFSAQKENVEIRLDKQGLKKFGFDIYERRAEPVATPIRRWEQPRKHHNHHYSTNDSKKHKENEDHPAALKYELKSSDIPEYAGSHLTKLVDLQHRELTPEDYELLLMLDESVAPKTVSRNLLQSLIVMTAEVAGSVGDLCSICMELYCASQNVKRLPCTHIFHEECIDAWLLNASLNCPLDGLAVEVT